MFKCPKKRTRNDSFETNWVLWSHSLTELFALVHLEKCLIFRLPRLSACLPRDELVKNLITAPCGHRALLDLESPCCSARPRTASTWRCQPTGIWRSAGNFSLSQVPIFLHSRAREILLRFLPEALNEFFATFVVVACQGPLIFFDHGSLRIHLLYRLGDFLLSSHPPSLSFGWFPPLFASTFSIFWVISFWNAIKTGIACRSSSTWPLYVKSLLMRELFVRIPGHLTCQPRPQQTWEPMEILHILSASRLNGAKKNYSQEHYISHREAGGVVKKCVYINKSECQLLTSKANWNQIRNLQHDEHPMRWGKQMEQVRICNWKTRATQDQQDRILTEL